ncbi:hypothetical protein DJ018_07580 [Phenylobacterium deserti]|uniref:Uncharacterized protein n=2 Tax=Phenylobacterium deserti TaxID=1914756 RepID=A0A328ARV0_9CAUL|nr:hypothetical protein DJ018_07580 [Phenylobacterium deserti]
MAERHGRMLGRLAELGMSLAERLHEDALAAETPKETADAARAFHTASRSVRQSLALEARLHREAQPALHAERERAEKDRAERLQARRRAVYDAGLRLIWTEVEPCEEEEADWTEALRELIDDLAAKPGFADAPLELVMAHLREGLDLQAPAPEAPDDADPDGPDLAEGEPNAPSARADPGWRGNG